jgi:hypothetical protein
MPHYVATGATTAIKGLVIGLGLKLAWISFELYRRKQLTQHQVYVYLRMSYLGNHICKRMAQSRTKGTQADETV